MKFVSYLWISLLIWSACTNQEEKQEKVDVPIVSNNGAFIQFKDSTLGNFFKTTPIQSGNYTADYVAPAKIAATVIASSVGSSQNIVLFDDANLASSYSALSQHQSNVHQIQQINIKQKEIELDRASDLLNHGAATGREVLEAQTALAMENTNLLNERAALIQYETDLKQGGFDPVELRNAPAGKVFVMCDIPENQIAYIHKGEICHISFAAFPEKIFDGKIEAVADVVDNITRMVKLRIGVTDTSNLLKAGMFAQVSFGLQQSSQDMTISNNALVTVDGKSYAFVKTGAGSFKRRSVTTGQQIGNRTVITAGLKPGEEVVIEGTIQLKGLSFGY